MTQIGTGTSAYYGGTNSFLEITDEGVFANNDGVVVRLEEPIAVDSLEGCEPMAVPRGSGGAWRIALFIVTRHDKCMKRPERKRGRPREANAITAAERMWAYRQRKKAAGLKNVRHWEPEAHSF